MGDFKDRLWRDLVREHGAQLAQTERPPAKHGRRARPRVLAGTTLGLAGIGTAVALALGAASSTPAFAVTRNHDGTVTVALQRIAAIHDANAKLAGSGLPVKLVQVKAGCVAAARAKALAALSKARPQSIAPLRWSGRARFNPRKIPPGKTLVIAAWPAGKSVHVSPGHLITGSAPACVPPPTPPPGACAISKLPPSSNSANTGTSAGTGAAPLPQVPTLACKGNVVRVTPVPRPLRALPCVAARIHVVPGGAAPTGTSGNTGTSTSSGASTNSATSTFPLPQAALQACKGNIARATPLPLRLLALPCAAARIHVLPPGVAPTGTSGNTGTSTGSGASTNSATSTVPLPQAAVKARKAVIGRARTIRQLLIRKACVAARIHALPPPLGNAAATGTSGKSGTSDKSGHTGNRGKAGTSGTSGTGSQTGTSGNSGAG